MQRSWKDSAVSLIVAGGAVLYGLWASSGTVPVFAILMTLVVGLVAFFALPVIPHAGPVGEAAKERPVRPPYDLAA